MIKISGVKNHGWRIAAKFKGDTLYRRTAHGKPTDVAAYARGPGERDQFGNRMQGKGVPDLLNRTDHNVEQPRRKTSFFVDLCKQQTASDRRVFRRLDHYTIAKREGRPNGT